MKSILLLATLFGAQFALAQEAGPSPTESIGCEPHGDHWHCEAARPTSAAAVAQSSAAVDPGPSPTASFGCEPHGDHWHCEGARATTAVAAPSSAAPVVPSSSAVAAQTSAAVDPGPSPTASFGCEPHGDHWHCEGAKSTLAVSSSAAPVAQSSHAAVSGSASGSVDPGPSPTASYGCEPHGDHWHCEGAKTTSVGASLTPVIPSSTRSSSVEVSTGAAAALGRDMLGLGLAVAGIIVFQ